MKINNWLAIFYQMKFVFNPARRTGFHFLSLVAYYSGSTSDGQFQVFDFPIVNQKFSERDQEIE